jgi:hypothetical protein
MIRSRVGVQVETDMTARVVVGFLDAARGAAAGGCVRDRTPIRAGRLRPPGRGTRRLDQTKPLITWALATQPPSAVETRWNFDRNKLLIGLGKAFLVHPRRQFAENETPRRQDRFRTGEGFFLSARRGMR